MESEKRKEVIFFADHELCSSDGVSNSLMVRSHIASNITIPARSQVNVRSGLTLKVPCGLTPQVKKPYCFEQITQLIFIKKDYNNCVHSRNGAIYIELHNPTNRPIILGGDTTIAVLVFSKPFFLRKFHYGISQQLMHISPISFLYARTRDNANLIDEHKGLNSLLILPYCEQYNLHIK